MAAAIREIMRNFNRTDSLNLMFSTIARAKKVSASACATPFDRKWYYIAISGCRSLSQFPRHTLLELAVVEKNRFVIKMSIMSEL